MARLSEVDRNQTIGMFVAGCSKSAIARHLRDRFLPAATSERPTEGILG